VVASVGVGYLRPHARESAAALHPSAPPGTHRLPRTTQDLDIVIDPPGLRELDALVANRDDSEAACTVAMTAVTGAEAHGRCTSPRSRLRAVHVASRSWPPMAVSARRGTSVAEHCVNPHA